jgi:DNA-binding NarL/FixJ family response regulator
MIHQARSLNGLIEGDLSAVADAASEGARLAREAGDLYSLGMMLMNRGYAALRTGEVDNAVDWLTDGLRVARRIDDRVAQCYLIGALGCAARDPRTAAQLLGASETLRGEIGAAVHPGMAPTLNEATRVATLSLGAGRFATAYSDGRAMTREAAVHLALREPPAAPAENASVLSRRETDVAGLVAEGLSNKEIGKRLFVSERTVESHVRNILVKLGFTTRTQVAAWLAKREGP